LPRQRQGFGGAAPNKLMASAEGKGGEPASHPCRRHGQKLVNINKGHIYALDVYAEIKKHDKMHHKNGKILLNS